MTHRLRMTAVVLAVGVATTVTLVLLGPGRDGDPATAGAPAGGPSAVAAAELRWRVPTAATTLLPAETPARVAFAATLTLVESAPLVVVAEATDAAALQTAGLAAGRLSSPLLLTGDGVTDGELAGAVRALGALAVLAVGSPELPDLGEVEVRHLDTDAAQVPPDLPAPPAPATVPDLLLLTDGSPEAPVALAGLTGLGLEVLEVPGADPRATSEAVEALAAHPDERLVAVGSGFGGSDRLTARVEVARTGVQLGGGGQLVFPAVADRPGNRYIALYGTPGTPALGLLGEQDVPATIVRAEQTAAPYRELTDDTVVPALEIIASIASAFPQADQSYSQMRTVDELRPLVEAAGAAGMPVILDLQPGRTDFLTQAQAYSELLALPHVGLALDPEWRLLPHQVHLTQIGSVQAAEVNAVLDWLATFSAERDLPQKMVVLHQFMLRMIADRDQIRTDHDELSVVIHVDGQGSQGAKAGTWAAIREGAPAGVHWGWKNFIDEDVPMLDPAGTFAVQPVPDLVTYQ